MARGLKDRPDDASGRGAGRPWRRRAAVGALTLAVAALHVLLGREIVEATAGFGLGDRMNLARLEVAFVRELAPAAPPPVPPETRVRPRPARAAAPARRASAPGKDAPGKDRPQASAAPRPQERTVSAGSEADELAVLQAAAEAAAAPAGRSSGEAGSAPLAQAAAVAAAPGGAQASAPVPAAPAGTPGATAAAPSTAPAASAASAALAAASAAPPPGAGFEWPPSTQLSYGLTGNFRGELHGDAQVRWIRQGERYQVHLDVAIGPRFAPLMSRRMTSDGLLGEHGLQPRRYEETSRMGFGPPRRAEMRFDDRRVVLANGESRPALPGLQDTASQFVQLTWMFTVQPALLKVGSRIELPLALPRRVDPWVYDVVEEQTLSTPVGELSAFHLKPRREPGAGVLTAEAWFAPGLQYLPVRILIHQDRETFIDLLIRTRPLQAEAGR